MLKGPGENTVSRQKHKLLRLQEALEIIIFIWACRTMLVQKSDGARFLIDTFELKISTKRVSVMTLTVCTCVVAMICTY